MPRCSASRRTGGAWMATIAVQTEIVICPDAAALAAEAADRIVAGSREAIARTGRFNFVLAGGSTPERTYALLAQSPLREAVDWSLIWLFFGDERFVPYDD